jgi:hypothetical protein
MQLSAAVASPRYVGSWRDWFACVGQGEERESCACCTEVVVIRWASWRFLGVSITVEWLVEAA